VSKFPRILAVDDNKQNLALLGKALTAAGYQVFTAEEGRSALELIATEVAPALGWRAAADRVALSV